MSEMCDPLQSYVCEAQKHLGDPTVTALMAEDSTIMPVEDLPERIGSAIDAQQASTGNPVLDAALAHHYEGIRQMRLRLLGKVPLERCVVCPLRFRDIEVE